MEVCPQGLGQTAFTLLLCGIGSGRRAQVRCVFIGHGTEIHQFVFTINFAISKAKDFP